MYFIGICMLLSACGSKKLDNELKQDDYVKVEPQPVEKSEIGLLQEENEFQEGVSSADTESVATLAPHQYLDAQGMTLESRINVPEGYERVETDEGSLTEFLRTYSLKEHGSPVLLYDGSEKWS